MQVTTEDGYILGLQRIPGGRQGVDATNESIPKKPFLLQHGILMVRSTGHVVDVVSIVLVLGGDSVWLKLAPGFST